jgi:hypothetical protein
MTFEEISLKGKRRWKDINGHWHQKTKIFSQTVSPFNLNKDGSVKTREQIMKEVNLACHYWKSNPGADAAKQEENN